MTMHNFAHMIKRLTGLSMYDLFLIGVIVLTASAAFGLGRLSVLYSTPAGFEVVPSSAESTSAAVLSGEGLDKRFVASRNGSKYHLPWCPGAQAMNEENKIWFTSKEDAERAGYSAALNCEGL